MRYYCLNRDQVFSFLDIDSFWRYVVNNNIHELFDKNLDLLPGELTIAIYIEFSEQIWYFFLLCRLQIQPISHDFKQFRNGFASEVVIALLSFAVDNIGK